MTTVPQTYDALVADIQNYMERADEAFLNSIPLFISNAQSRIATELKSIITKVVVNSALSAGQSVLPKPGRYKNLIFFEASDSLTTLTYTALRWLDYGVARMMNPNPAITGVPNFVSDYDIDHFLITPTPDQAYPIQIAYYQVPDPLTDLSQTNALTKYAYNLLLYASLLEALPFEKMDERAKFDELYGKALAQYVNEDAMRIRTGYTVRSIN